MIYFPIFLMISGNGVAGISSSGGTLHQTEIHRLEHEAGIRECCHADVSYLTFIFVKAMEAHICMRRLISPRSNARD